MNSIESAVRHPSAMRLALGFIYIDIHLFKLYNKLLFSVNNM